MNTEPVVIDTIIPGRLEDHAGDHLLLEWFEVNKHRLTRSTLAGNDLLLELQRGAIWHQGDALYAQGKLQAVIAIKPTLTIRFDPLDFTQLADFTYFIGNRHLPIFKAEHTLALRLPYDGRLYEQLLSKYSTAIQLEEAVLVTENSIRQQLKDSRKNENN